MTFPETRRSLPFGRQCASLGFDWNVSLALLRRSEIIDKDEVIFAESYNGHPAALHFVGFRGDEYSSAVRVWGRPDFFHRNWDRRVLGDIAPGDTVIFAKGDETCRFNEYVFDDSAVMWTYRTDCERGGGLVVRMDHARHCMRLNEVMR